MNIMVQACVIGSVLMFAGVTLAENENWENWMAPQEFSLYPALPIAAPMSDDEKCREDSRMLIQNLKKKTYWAMQSKKIQNYKFFFFH